MFEQKIQARLVTKLESSLKPCEKNITLTFVILYLLYHQLQDYHVVKNMKIKNTILYLVMGGIIFSIILLIYQNMLKFPPGEI